MTAVSEENGPNSESRDIRRAILTASAQLFAERGYGATSVREVVEAAGCKKPTLYYYFQNKEQLYLEVLRVHCDEFNASIGEAMAQGGSVRERIARSFDVLLRLVRERPTLLKLFMSAEHHPEVGQPFFDFDALRQQHVDAMCAVFAEGIQLGELRAGLDLEEAVLALFGMLDHRLVLFLHGRPIPDDLADRLLDIFFNGVRA